MLALMSSFSRAGMVGAATSSLLVCVAIRRYRIIVKGFSMAVIVAIVMVMFVPLPQEAPSWNGADSISSLFLYKGKRQQGILGSREGPWSQTWSVIQDHPWFGSGFGTSLVGEDLTKLTFAQH